MRKTALLIGIFFLEAAMGQSTLESVRSKGYLQCGVNTGLAGFSQPDSRGVWRGIDVDLCRAVAAAVLGDASKVRYTPLTAQQRFTALQSGEVDVLSQAPGSSMAPRSASSPAPPRSSTSPITSAPTR